MTDQAFIQSFAKKAFIKSCDPEGVKATQTKTEQSCLSRMMKTAMFLGGWKPAWPTGTFGGAAAAAQSARRRIVRDRVIDRLKAYWSPEQIAGRLWADGVSLVRLCAETIYRFIYGKEDYGLGLYRYLPEARRKRRPRGSVGHATACSQPTAGYRKDLILLAIEPSSAIGKATC